MKASEEKGLKSQIPLKNREKRKLIDNEMSKGKIAVVGDQVNGKKERSRRLNKTVNPNAADILPNTAAKTSHTSATNNSKNAGMVATASKASEDRKISCRLTFAHTTE